MSSDERSPVARAVERNHEDAMRAVEEALGHIQYGSILITIHQGEVVGIET